MPGIIPKGKVWADFIRECRERDERFPEVDAEYEREYDEYLISIAASLKAGGFEGMPLIKPKPKRTYRMELNAHHSKPHPFFSRDNPDIRIKF